MPRGGQKPRDFGEEPKGSKRPRSSSKPRPKFRGPSGPHRRFGEQNGPLDRPGFGRSLGPLDIPGFGGPHWIRRTT